jgi:hypothetical protein
MSLTYTIEPIDVWPGEKTRNRTRSSFKTIWTKVLTHLEREIRHLGGQRSPRRPPGWRSTGPTQTGIRWPARSTIRSRRRSACSAHTTASACR